MYLNIIEKDIQLALGKTWFKIMFHLDIFWKKPVSSLLGVMEPSEIFLKFIVFLTNVPYRNVITCNL